MRPCVSLVLLCCVALSVWLVVGRGASATDGAAPQTAVPPQEQTPSATNACMDQQRSLNATALLDRTVEETRREATGQPRSFGNRRFVDVAARVVYDDAPSGNRMRVLLHNGGQGGEVVWPDVRFIAMAYLHGSEETARPIRAERYAPRTPDGARQQQSTDGADITLARPEGGGGWIVERWVAVIAVCREPDGLIGYTQVEFTQISAFWAFSLAAAAVVLLYFICVLAALALHRKRLEARLRQSEPDLSPSFRRRFLRALDPVFVTQDATGVASLARLQLLLFTLAISGVYTYVTLRTGSLSTLSQSVLLLLGISAIGGGLARVTGDGNSLTTGNRMWLTARGVLRPIEGLPRWRDIVTAGGEVDVSRLQAIAFSVFTAGALLARGPDDLSAFAVPEQLLWLIGVSQAVYVAGRAVPPEAVRRANQEMDTLRAAERAALDGRQRGDTAAAEVARAGFVQARAALAVTLADVLHERFDDAALALVLPP